MSDATRHDALQVALPLGLAVLLSPIGAVALIFLNPYGFVAWLTLALVGIAIAWRLRGRVQGLVDAPPRLFVTSFLGCIVLAVSSFGFLLAVFYETNPPFSATDVLDATQLPAGARILIRRDAGTESASESTIVFAMPGPVAADDLHFPTGFAARSLPSPSYACDWQTPNPCDATLVVDLDGRDADFANGYCSIWLVNQSNTVDLNGWAGHVAAVTASCSEGMSRPSN